MAREKKDRSKEPFDDLTKLTRSTQWSLTGLGAATAVMFAAELFQRFVVTGIQDGNETAYGMADLSDGLVGITALAYLPAFLVSGILSLMFIYRANLNAQRLVGEPLENSPGWAVGSYFVPFMNLFVPYFAMKEIWQASENPQYPQRVDPPGLLPAWWALWLITGFTGQVSTRLTLAAEEIDDILFANAISLAADVVAFALVVVFYLLVTRIYRMQMDHAAARVFA
jgi:hypothetical protein